MKSNIIKNKYFLSGIFIFFVSSIIFLNIHGFLGNPTSEEINTSRWKQNGPFELSPERGRFALLYSFIEDHSLKLSLPLARFSAPDVAVTSDGQYASLFMPGISFLAIPGYYLGRYFGAAQVGTFAVISLFAILNLFLIRAIAIRLGVNKIAATLTGFVFVFATPAFPYAVSFYQHHISVFIMLLSIYILLRWRNVWSLAAVWFLCAASVVVDNPNLILMTPIGIYALGRFVSLEKDKFKYRLKIKPLLILTFITVILPIGFFLWFNKTSYGNPFQLPGTLPSVEAIDENGKPISADLEKILTGSSGEEAKNEKTAVGFFKTRNLLTGFYIHLASPDRGILWFTPVIFLGICGLVLLYRKNKNVANLFMSVVGANILLYSMWGDPWGGWAFGSRYLIPTYALMSVGLGIALSEWKKKFWFLLIFGTLFLYSAGVNTLGALTSNANPPQVQVLELEKLSSKVQKYTYARNWQYLQEKGSKSVVFREKANEFISAKQYYFIVYSLIAIAGILMLIILTRSNNIIKDRKK